MLLIIGAIAGAGFLFVLVHALCTAAKEADNLFPEDLPAKEQVQNRRPPLGPTDPVQGEYIQETEEVRAGAGNTVKQGDMPQAAAVEEKTVRGGGFRNRVGDYFLEKKSPRWTARKIRLISMKEHRHTKGGRQD